MPAGPLTFQLSPVPDVPLLAEVDFPPNRVQQEALPGNLRVLVEIMANALGQPVDWRPPVVSERNTLTWISSDHTLLSFLRQLTRRRSSRAKPGYLIEFPTQPSCQGAESGVSRG